MTRDNIIRIAREASVGNEDRNVYFELVIEELEAFAALIAAAEREAIIKATIDQGFVGQAYADDFAAVIRNRVKQ